MSARHDWEAVRLSTSREQLHARLLVVDAVGLPNPEHVGRHRAEPCRCGGLAAHAHIPFVMAGAR